MPEPQFDPSKPFSLADAPPPAFDPSKPFDVHGQPQSSNSALVMQATAKGIPLAAHIAEVAATSPTLARTVGTVARVGTTLGAIGHGIATGNPSEIIMSPVAGWSAGKGGYWLGRGAQSVAGPLATALDALKPYAQAISTVSGAQGVLDLAQMADKTRTDIGTLGFSLTGERSQAEKDAHPALLNAVVGKISDLASSLKENGVPAAEALALKLVSDGNAATFGRLMTLYMKYKTVQP